MTLTEIDTTPLEELGFGMDGDWGHTTPEPYDLGKDHFIPKIRDVYIGNANGGYYVTSSLFGDYRKYRTSKVLTGYAVGNIFGSGKTADEAIANFIDNYKNKRYNLSK